MNTTKLLQIIGIVLVVGLLAWAFQAYTQKKAPEQTATPLLKVGDSEIGRGTRGALITLVEYADFQCPACGSYYPIIKKVEDTFGKDIFVVFRQFPLAQIHQNALLAAKASEAAKQQNKFFEMHDLLFERQKDWSDKNDALTIFTGYAKELGLDEARFVSAIKDPNTEKTIKDSYNEGVLLKVDHTPTFFVNGVKIENPASFDDFKTIIQAALLQAKAKEENSKKSTSTSASS